MEDDIAERFENQASLQGKVNSGGRGRGGRGGRSGGRGGRDRELSHALSRLLRHQAENAGIKLDREGYAPLDRVLQWGPLRSLAPSFSEIQSAVRDSDKQRFTLKPHPDAGFEAGDALASTDPADWLIRANQGHSIKLESNDHLTPLALPSADGGELPPGSAAVPPVVVHGTYFAFWPTIVESGGLRPMGRSHVHCSTGLPGAGTGVISGMRADAELLVYVDVARSIDEGGLKWWMSQNGVVLTEGGEGGLVPVKYFREVVGRRPDVVGVLWKDGEKVADLPKGIKMQIPRGKERVSRGGRRGGSNQERERPQA
ncbi:hypothetical protein GQ53DRAFT_756046 [Thozetella sp. PMI_491]|nr:hypothetical protein GQ53DRAFT_756046 [Thozetella sp. PMI_491]